MGAASDELADAVQAYQEVKAEADEMKSNISDATDVDEQLKQLYAETLWDSWESEFSAFNPGQQVIYSQHLADHIGHWIDHATSEGQWPNLDEQAYSEFVYGCYNWELMERAFSDCIARTADSIEPIIDEAQENQSMLLDMIGMLSNLFDLIRDIVDWIQYAKLEAESEG